MTIALTSKSNDWRLVQTETIPHNIYIITGIGYRFQLIVSSSVISLTVLGSKKYQPPVRCVEYLYYYDARRDLTLANNVLDFFTEQAISYQSYDKFIKKISKYICIFIDSVA